MTRFHRGKVLAFREHPNGCGATYLQFYCGGGKYWMFNRAVCWSFNGPPPSDLHQAAHLDRDTFNNRPDNLMWCTALENSSHKILHGTNPNGSKNGSSRLNESDILPICTSYIAGESANALANKFNVCRGTIILVVRRATWKSVHLPSGMDDFLTLRRRHNREHTDFGASV